MVHKCIGTLLLTAALAACGNRPVAGTAPNGKNKETKYATCYRFASGGDSIRMQLFIADSGIKGTLLYDHPARESQGGFFTGETRGDTLFAEYTFKAGGQAGVREVAFLRKGTGLLEGSGATENRMGKTVFANHAALTFSESRLLEPVECAGANSQ
ncbi:hypothetical protein V9K67_02110 [Paraflavisolibacter sp. H34]|uniref:hypothetical protein n=1 Tax=Huijunlia imazamoxiresistens TaxID=3127457 RepID=UPI00301856F1